MTINFANTDLIKLRQLSRQQSILQILNSKQNAVQNKNKDLFIKSTTYDAGIYTNAVRETKKMISNSVLTAMNNNIANVHKHGDILECEGIFFTADQIPQIDKSTLGVIKAENNVMDFGSNKYFKYVSPDGKEHALYTDYKGIGSLVSDIMRGEPYDPTLERYARFWNYLMSKDPAYIGLSYSTEEIRDYLKEAGIQTGFITIKMGDREATQFYSASKTSGPIHSKVKYDLLYESYTEGGSLLRNFEPGSVFRIGEKEYVLREDHTLDIPYGEDIYCLEDPPNYRFGKKIEE